MLYFDSVYLYVNIRGLLHSSVIFVGSMSESSVFPHQLKLLN